MIVKIPDIVLTTPSKSIEKIDKKIIDIVSLMKKTLTETDKPKGVGLAAPQIGIGLKLFITRPTLKSDIEVFINPEILERSKEVSEIRRIEKDMENPGHEKKLEGCLSIPNVWGYLKRPERVKLRYMDLEGKTVEREFKGFMATIVQHETDHLHGILFTRRVLEQNQKLFQIELNEKGEEKLVEIDL